MSRPAGFAVSELTKARIRVTNLEAQAKTVLLRLTEAREHLKAIEVTCTAAESRAAVAAAPTGPEDLEKR